MEKGLCAGFRVPFKVLEGLPESYFKGYCSMNVTIPGVDFNSPPKLLKTRALH